MATGFDTLELNRSILDGEMRYWVGVLVVSERGSGVLVTGFIALVVGLIWRLSWHRREVALTWDDREFRLVGRSEYFSGRFREELGSIQAELARPSRLAGNTARS